MNQREKTIHNRKKRMRKRRRIHRIKIIGVFLLFLAGLGFGLHYFMPGEASGMLTTMGNISPSELASYPDWLQEMVKKNPETRTFAKDYKNREDYIGKPIDLSGEYRQGQVIVCSMAPGDFTTTGHFILIRGYGKDGFYVNDPNRKANCEKTWDFETLQGQIKRLWALA